MRQQRMCSLEIDHPGGAGDMADLQRPLKAISVRLDEASEPLHHRGFVIVDGMMGAYFFQEWIAVHDFQYRPT